MLRDKRLYFLLSLTILFRLPAFLFRGAPAGDETTYLGEILRLFDQGQSVQGLSPASVPKLAFLLFNAPFVGFFYSLTGNAGVSVSVLPFLLSIFSLIIIYRLAWRLYGRDSAYWAGLFYAVIPFLALRSHLMMTDVFFTAVFLLATLFLNKYLDSQRTAHLFGAFILLSLLCSVRPEGYIIFALAAAFAIQYSWAGWRRMLVSPLSPLSVSVVCFLGVKLFLSAFIFSGLIQISNDSTSSVLYGKLLGNMARRIQALYGVPLPGGFTSSAKLDYFVTNWSIIALAGITWLYDIFKTTFVLTSRTLPPLFFAFIGIAIVDDSARARSTRYTEAFLVTALTSMFIYPMVYLLSHSRYVFLFPVISILFMARGLSLLEKKTSERLPRWNSSRIVRLMLTMLVILYVLTAFYLLQVGEIWQSKTRTVFSTGQVDSDGIDDKLIRFIKQHSPGPETVVMAEGEWVDLIKGVKILPFPVEVMNDGGKWVSLPVSYQNTVKILCKSGEALLVLKRSQLYQMQLASDRIRYFSESLSRNLPYGDEGLELMRDRSEKDKQMLFSEFLPLWEGNINLKEFEPAIIISAEGSVDSVKVFRCVH